MQTPDPTPTAPKDDYTRWQWFQFFLFWSWNLIFLAFMALGFAPVMLPETFTAVRTGAIPVEYLLYGLVLALIPVVCVILGLTVLRRQPDRLFTLGYVIEGPLMLLLAVRFFAIRQASFGVVTTMTIALLGMAALLWTLLDSRPGERRPAYELFRLVGLTLMAIVSLYAAVWIAFYAIPLGVEGIRGLLHFLDNLLPNLRELAREFIEGVRLNPIMLPFTILGMILVLYTGTLFVLTPIAVPLLSLRAWWRSLSSQVRRQGAVRPILLFAITLFFTSWAFVAANRQPQVRAFTLLEKPPASTAEAVSLLKQSETIRLGLLNAYLAPFRYISAQGGVRHISDIYAGTFKLPPQKAFAVQRLYERIASPLLYQPVNQELIQTGQDSRAFAEESQQAAELYQRFFDVPINDAERQTIVAAARSTWSGDQALAARQAVDDREVHLVSQALSLQPHGDWADLELHEVYQNQTSDLQEVIYYFNLPESAVLTGLWLGNTPDKDHAFAFQVAPRGAAQAVYREETRQMRDPALLEQIGPRQYRLRVYPVPRLTITYDQKKNRSLVSDAPPLYLWLTWREFAHLNHWDLPNLAYKRNVYWDAATQRTFNGQPLAVGDDAWLPKSLPTAEPITPHTHRLDLPGGYTVIATPVGQAQLPALPQPLRLALVLDRSRSMAAHAAEAAAAIEQLKASLTPDSVVDVYLTASAYRGEDPSVIPLAELDVPNLFYFGGQNPAELVAQYQALRGDRRYDAILVLTDETAYELGASHVSIAVPDAPLWMVHLGDSLPLGYDDPTLEAIQASGGGISGDVQSALQRLAVYLDAKAWGADLSSDLVDGYYWMTLPTDQTQGMPDPDPLDGFAAIAARRLILAEMQRNKGTITDLETLDYLHSLATEYAIVTPFSSMIVLVDAQQQALLDKLASLGDRYQREVEVMGNTAPASPLPLTGVPEPHEYLLMALAAAMLLYLLATRRKRHLSPFL